MTRRIRNKQFFSDRSGALTIFDNVVFHELYMLYSPSNKSMSIRIETNHNIYLFHFHFGL